MIKKAEGEQALLNLLPGNPLRAASVKVSTSGISDGRRLYTLPKSAFDQSASTQFMKTAEAFLGHKADALQPWLDICEMVHFGLDPASGADRLPVRKVYLELVTSTPSDPDLTFIALKAAKGGLRLNRYHTIPLANEGGADQLLASLGLPDWFTPLARGLTRAIVFGSADYATLLVTEDGTDRRSLDFNFADEAASDAALAAIEKLLAGLGQTAASISQLLAAPLCHVAIGVSSDGTPFATLYGFPEGDDV